MSNKEVLMKRLVLAGVVIAPLLGVARPARAQWAVVDAGNIAQSVLTVANTAKTVANTLQQIEQMKTQIQNQLQTLKSIDPTSFNSLMSLLDQSKLTYAMIRNDVDSLGFSVQEINRDFDGLFPKDKSKWRSIKYSDYDGYYSRWNSELTASAKAADRAQSRIALVEKDNQAIADILARAQTATGEVRQLQLINQQLALIHARLGDLVQNIATLGRITSNMAASSAGEKLLLREAKLRRRDGYTSRGAPARTLNRLP
jgi:P-type conjugative transfer protein TrbJ